MRLSARRTLIGAAVLMAGIFGLHQTSSEAADPLPESELKTLFDQDAKNIQDMIALGKTKEKKNMTKASRAIKSNAMMVAYYADRQITGKDAASDAKFATLRDAAIKIAVAGGKKKFDDAEKAAKMLSLDVAGGKGPAKQMGAAALKDAIEPDVEELMYQFKKTSVGGLEGEAEIKANSKKLTLAPAKIAALAARVEAVADYCESVGVAFDAKKTKKDWDAFNKDMRTAAQGLMTAAKGKNAKAIQTAFDKVDRSCTACHEKMK